MKRNAEKLDKYLRERKDGITSSIEGVITEEEFKDIEAKVKELLTARWLDRLAKVDPKVDLCYRAALSETSLFNPRSEDSRNENWNVKQSLREVAPSIVIKTVQQ